MAVILLAITTGGCSLIANTTQHSIETSIDVKVSDSNLRRLTDITERAAIKSSGKFKSGSFLVNGLIVSIAPDTTFKIELELPIEDPAIISTKKAIGTFSTSKQISIDAIPAPLVVDLGAGKISGEINLARSMTAFLLNLVQVGSPSGGMRQMIDAASLDKLVLALRPDSTLVIGKKRVNIGAGSRIELLRAVIDRDFNYVGTFIMKLNFGKGSKWLGEKVDVCFEGGSALLDMTAIKDGNSFKLTLPKEAERSKRIELTDCSFDFGKNKRSSTFSKTCLINLAKFQWQDNKNQEHPTMSFSADMNMTETDLRLKTDIHQTLGHFPAVVPGKLDVVIGPKDRSVHFVTVKAARASEGKIIIAKGTTTVSLILADTVVGPVDYDTSHQLSFQLEGGKAKVKELDWQAHGSSFNLKCGAGSVLTVPAEMYLHKESSGKKTKLQLPLALDLGEATLKLKSGSLNFPKLKGVLMLYVDDNLRIASDLTFSLGKSSLLAGHQANVNASGLELDVVDGVSRIKLEKCSVLVPDLAVEKAIASKVPSTMNIKLNKTLRQDRKWRYRNVVAGDVKVTNFLVKNLVSKPDETLAFTASGDVRVEGTVEKGGLVFHRNDGWKTCPWKLTGHVTGKGKSGYRFHKEKNSAQELLDYDLSMTFVFPDDVELDWSKVAGGILKVAERKVILGRLKEFKIPIEHKGQLTVFEKNDPLWRHLKISDLALTDTDDGVRFDFNASTKL